MAASSSEPIDVGKQQLLDGVAPDHPRGRLGGKLSAWRPKTGRLLMAGAVLGGLAIVGWFTWQIFESLKGEQQTLVLHTVSRGDLAIMVTERGNLESQRQTEIVSEVENLGSDRSGNSGAQILFIVPNGSQVSEGDLLVELDAAPIRELLDNQVLSYERARSEHLQAEAKYKNQITQNETSLAEAQLQVELAELELEMYRDEEDGTLATTLQELDLKIEETKNQILESQNSLFMVRTEAEGIETLNKLGYRGQGDLDDSKLKLLRAEGEVVRSTNALQNAVSNRRKLTEYESRMRTLELEGAVATAERRLVQVERDNEALLAQAQAALDAAERSLTKEEERLENYRRQVELCNIHAPHDGMAVYAVERRRSSSTTISEGAFVRQRQQIISLPDLSQMQVKTSVHESVLDQVSEGLPGVVRVDAFPDRVYRATVSSVAVLPDQSNWFSSDIKVYETVVTIDEQVKDLKPGMTAVVEIKVDRLRNVLSVPVQAIVQVGSANWCYVKTPGGVERRSIDLGRTNDKFVEIRDGLEDGDRVVLNPMAIVDERELQREEEEAKTENAVEGLADDESAATEESAESTDQQPAVAPTDRGPSDDADSQDQGADDPTQEGRGGRRRGGFGEDLTPEQREEFMRRMRERREGGGQGGAGGGFGEDLTPEQREEFMRRMRERRGGGGQGGGQGGDGEGGGRGRRGRGEGPDGGGRPGGGGRRAGADA